MGIRQAPGSHSPSRRAYARQWHRRLRRNDLPSRVHRTRVDQHHCSDRNATSGFGRRTLHAPCLRRGILPPQTRSCHGVDRRRDGNVGCHGQGAGTAPFQPMGRHLPDASGRGGLPVRNRLDAAQGFSQPLSRQRLPQFQGQDRHGRSIRPV